MLEASIARECRAPGFALVSTARSYSKECHPAFRRTIERRMYLSFCEECRRPLKARYVNHRCPYSRKHSPFTLKRQLVVSFSAALARTGIFYFGRSLMSQHFDHGPRGAQGAVDYQSCQSFIMNMRGQLMPVHQDLS